MGEGDGGVWVGDGVVRRCVLCGVGVLSGGCGGMVGELGWRGVVKEVGGGLGKVGGSAREDKVTFAFQVFDLDCSGAINASGLKKIVKATNMASAKQLDRKMHWLMKQCDADGDGNISYEEFVNLAKKFPNIVVPACSLPAVWAG